MFKRLFGTPSPSASSSSALTHSSSRMTKNEALIKKWQNDYTILTQLPDSAEKFARQIVFFDAIDALSNDEKEIVLSGLALKSPFVRHAQMELLGKALEQEGPLIAQQLLIHATTPAAFQTVVEETFCKFDIAALRLNYESPKARSTGASNLMLLVGKTGAGKTSALHYFLGADFKYEINNFRESNGPIEAINFAIGHGTDSETKDIRAIPLHLNKMKLHIPEPISICDTPGFEDTQGPIEAVNHSILLAEAVNAADVVRVVVVISISDFAGREPAFLSALDSVAKLFPQAIDDLSAFSYVITGRTNDQSANEIMQVIGRCKGIKDDTRVSAAAKNLLEDMEKKFKALKTLQFIDLHKKSSIKQRIELVNSIITRPAIDVRTQKLAPFIEKTANDTVAHQLEMHVTTILTAVARAEQAMLTGALIDLSNIEFKFKDLLFMRKHLPKSGVDQRLKEVNELFKDLQRKAQVFIADGLSKVTDNELTYPQVKQLKSVDVLLAKLNHSINLIQDDAFTPTLATPFPRVVIGFFELELGKTFKILANALDEDALNTGKLGTITKNLKLIPTLILEKKESNISTILAQIEQLEIQLESEPENIHLRKALFAKRDETEDHQMNENANAVIKKFIETYSTTLQNRFADIEKTNDFITMGDIIDKVTRLSEVKEICVVGDLIHTRLDNLAQSMKQVVQKKLGNLVPSISPETTPLSTRHEELTTVLNQLNECHANAIVQRHFVETLTTIETKITAELTTYKDVLFNSIKSIHSDADNFAGISALTTPLAECELLFVLPCTFLAEFKASFNDLVFSSKTYAGTFAIKMGTTLSQELNIATALYSIMKDYLEKTQSAAWLTKYKYHEQTDLQLRSMINKRINAWIKQATALKLDLENHDNIGTYYPYIADLQQLETHFSSVIEPTVIDNMKRTRQSYYNAIENTLNAAEVGSETIINLAAYITICEKHEILTNTTHSAKEKIKLFLHQKYTRQNRELLDRIKKLTVSPLELQVQMNSKDLEETIKKIKTIFTAFQWTKANLSTYYVDLKDPLTQWSKLLGDLLAHITSTISKAFLDEAGIGETPNLSTMVKSCEMLAILDVYLSNPKDGFGSLFQSYDATMRSENYAKVTEIIRQIKNGDFDAAFNARAAIDPNTSLYRTIEYQVTTLVTGWTSIINTQKEKLQTATPLSAGKIMASLTGYMQKLSEISILINHIALAEQKDMVANAAEKAIDTWFKSCVNAVDNGIKGFNVLGVCTEIPALEAIIKHMPPDYAPQEAYKQIHLLKTRFDLHCNELETYFKAGTKQWKTQKPLVICTELYKAQESGNKYADFAGIWKSISVVITTKVITECDDSVTHFSNKTRGMADSIDSIRQSLQVLDDLNKYPSPFALEFVSHFKSKMVDVISRLRDAAIVKDDSDKVFVNRIQLLNHAELLQQYTGAHLDLSPIENSIKSYCDGLKSEIADSLTKKQFPQQSIQVESVNCCKFEVTN